MLGTLLSQISLVLVLTGCLTALLIGGPRERLGGAAYLTTFGLQAGLYYVGLTAPGINPGLDGALLIALVALCWKSPHPWPVWALGFQLIAVMIPIVRLSDPRIQGWAYYTAMTLSGYVVLLAIVTGAFIARKRRKGLKSQK
ncbi:hypothetical protein [Asticcacaulis sp. YBE204]|uniref:hypothetical protein n=1 Tax=Asticcacaulis sp. YBE204 TaxID=1282363 RepID=UPI0003C3B67A|nr:hypothetical protein [Asticcacaulis sp. YBE204]ESQ78806.1 hypothetical protein AEYBE204_12545 [Asticcacaulis sp. YBE204]